MVAVAVVVVVVSAVAWAMANYIHVPPGSPEVPKLDVTVQDQEEQRCRDGALSLLRHLRPHWDPREVTLQVRPGGHRASFLKPPAWPPERLPGMAAAALVMLEGSFLSSQTPQPIRLPRSSAALPPLRFPPIPALSSLGSSHILRASRGRTPFQSGMTRDLLLPTPGC